jgi:stalled ribosome alternative rescue factor ArfA
MLGATPATVTRHAEHAELAELAGADYHRHPNTARSLVTDPAFQAQIRTSRPPRGSAVRRSTYHQQTYDTRTSPTHRTRTRAVPGV